MGMQRLWRGHLHRISTGVIRTNLLHQRHSSAALAIQLLWRKAKARVAEDRLARLFDQAYTTLHSFHAATLQRFARGWAGRRAAWGLKIAADTALLTALQRRSIAALRIQSVWRGYLARCVAWLHRARAADDWIAVIDGGSGYTYYRHKITMEARWSRPQVILDALPRPTCDNCSGGGNSASASVIARGFMSAQPTAQGASSIALPVFATIECANCQESFCYACWGAVHSGGHRRSHLCRQLYDAYGHRLDPDRPWSNISNASASVAGSQLSAALELGATATPGTEVQSELWYQKQCQQQNNHVTYGAQGEAHLVPASSYASPFNDQFTVPQGGVYEGAAYQQHGNDPSGELAATALLLQDPAVPACQFTRSSDLAPSSLFHPDSIALSSARRPFVTPTIAI